MDVFHSTVPSELHVFFSAYFTFSLGVNWVIEDPELLEFLKSKLQQMFSMSSLMSHLQDKF